MYQGYIKLWRKFKETSFFKNPNAAHLAVYLLLECNHEPKKFVFNGEEITIDRGQCLTGRVKIAFDTGMSEQNVRTSLDILKLTSFLTIKATNRFSIISIGNYGRYQDVSTTKLTSNLTNHQPATNQPLTTNNNYKNDNNEKNTTISAKADGNKPVNWENCRTDHQRLAAYYLKYWSAKLYASATVIQANAFFKRQSRPLISICEQAGDIATAKKCLDLAAEYYSKRGLTWTLDTIASNMIEFIDKAKAGVSQ